MNLLDRILFWRRPKLVLFEFPYFSPYQLSENKAAERKKRNQSAKNSRKMNRQRQKR
jgi:hypothetical protein